MVLVVVQVMAVEQVLAVVDPSIMVVQGFDQVVERHHQQNHLTQRYIHMEQYQSNHL